MWAVYHGQYIPLALGKTGDGGAVAGACNGQLQEDTADSPAKIDKGTKLKGPKRSAPLGQTTLQLAKVCSCFPQHTLVAFWHQHPQMYNLLLSCTS